MGFVGETNLTGYGSRVQLICVRLSNSHTHTAIDCLALHVTSASPVEERVAEVIVARSDAPPISMRRPKSANSIVENGRLQPNARLLIQINDQAFVGVD
jgi:hypothetical protein